MAGTKQFTTSLAALLEYQPKGQDKRYPFGAESLAKLDEYITLKITEPGYDQALEIDLIELDVFVYKYFDNFGWFFGMVSRFWSLNDIGYVQVDQQSINSLCTLFYAFYF
jgi:hypothetical protein